MLLAVFLDEIEDLRERPAIQKVLQLGRAILSVHRRIRRAPFLLVVRLPLTLEILFPPARGPELRLLQMERLRAGVERPLHTGRQIAAVIQARRDVRNRLVAAMQNPFTLAVGLRFIPVPRSVELAVEVVLILSPRDAGHHMDGVAVIAPTGDIGRHFRTDPVHHGDIAIDIHARLPGASSLKTQPFVAGIAAEPLLAGIAAEPLLAGIAAEPLLAGIAAGLLLAGIGDESLLVGIAVSTKRQRPQQKHGQSQDRKDFPHGYSAAGMPDVPQLVLGFGPSWNRNTPPAMICRCSIQHLSSGLPLSETLCT